MNIPLTYRAGIRVLLHRPAYDLDITSRVLNASIDTGDVSTVGTGSLGADAVAATLTMTLDGAEPFLSPLAVSSVNDPRPLLRPYRKVTVMAGGDGEEAFPLFVGYLGDSVTVDTSAKTRRITVTARDISKPFQDSYRVTFPTLGGVGVTVPQVLQALIDLLPPLHRPALVVPEAPNLLLQEAYTPQHTTVWNAMQELVTAMGWYLGADGNNLLLLNPPRGADVADIELDADDVFQDNVSVTDTDIRNRVTIEWSVGGQMITKTDQNSVDNVTDGVVKHSFIQYNDLSPIRTSAAAEAVADVFLADMAYPHAFSRLTLPFLPSIKVFTILGINNPLISGDARLVSVTSVRHSFDSAGVARTVVLGTERVIGGHANWMRQERKP